LGPGGEKISPKGGVSSHRIKGADRCNHILKKRGDYKTVCTYGAGKGDAGGARETFQLDTFAVEGGGRPQVDITPAANTLNFSEGEKGGGGRKMHILCALIGKVNQQKRERKG